MKCLKVIKTAKKRRNKVKIIVMYPEKNLYIITKAVEKKKTCIGRNNKRYPKSRCVLWTPEREDLINELEVEYDEFSHNKEIILRRLRASSAAKKVPHGMPRGIRI